MEVADAPLSADDLMFNSDLTITNKHTLRFSRVPYPCTISSYDIAGKVTGHLDEDLVVTPDDEVTFLPGSMKIYLGS